MPSKQHHVSPTFHPASRAAPYAKRADQARHVRRPTCRGRSTLHPAAQAAQAAGLKASVSERAPSPRTSVARFVPLRSPNGESGVSADLLDALCNWLLAVHETPLETSCRGDGCALESEALAGTGPTRRTLAPSTHEPVSEPRLHYPVRDPQAANPSSVTRGDLGSIRIAEPARRRAC